MTAEIIHDDDVTRREGRREHLIDIGLEGASVDGPIKDHWRDHAAEPQARDEGRRFPMAVRDESPQPLAPQGAPSRARHVGGRPGLVDEDELFQIEMELAVPPGFARLQDVRPLLLAGVRGLFLIVILRRWKKGDRSEKLRAVSS